MATENTNSSRRYLQKVRKPHKVLFAVVASLLFLGFVGYLIYKDAEKVEYQGNEIKQGYVENKEKGNEDKNNVEKNNGYSDENDEMVDGSVSEENENIIQKLIYKITKNSKSNNVNMDKEQEYDTKNSEIDTDMAKNNTTEIQVNNDYIIEHIPTLENLVDNNIGVLCESNDKNESYYTNLKDKALLVRQVGSKSLYVLTKNEANYIWNSDSDAGQIIDFKNPPIEAANILDVHDNIILTVYNYAKSGNYTCTSWNIDYDMFKLPNNIKFEQVKHEGKN